MENIIFVDSVNMKNNLWGFELEICNSQAKYFNYQAMLISDQIDRNKRFPKHLNHHLLMLFKDLKFLVNYPIRKNPTGV